MRSQLPQDTDLGHLVEEITSAVGDAVRSIATELQQPHVVGRDRMAELLGVGIATLDRLVSANEIPSILVGNRRKFEPRRVLDALAAKTEKEGVE